MSGTSSSQGQLPKRPKGILKKPTSTFSPPHDHQSSDHQTQPQQPDRDPTTARNRALLQTLLSANPSLLNPPIPPETFELLSTLPHAPCPPHSASHPSPADARLFLTHLRDFRPGEYLDLIEERNCLGRCGYALCPRPRRTFGGQKFKLVSTSTSVSQSQRSIVGKGTGRGEPAEAAVARTEDLNKWCSDACARRALYLKVQLDNPSYERAPGWSAAAGGGGGAGEWVVKLELREEGEGGKKAPIQAADQKKEEGSVELRGGGGDAAAAHAQDSNQGLTQTMAQLKLDKPTPAPDRGSDQDREQLARAMAQLELDRTKQAKRDASALAGERGDAAAGLLAGHSRVEVAITEKSEVEPPQPPELDENADAHLLVEGYKPAWVSKKKPAGEGAESDDDDGDDDEFPTIRF